LGTSKSTLIVITSDHGEALGDHGGWGHKNTLYEEQLRVPLIMSYPEKVAAGRRVPGQVSLLDIAPTILELIGVEAPDSFQGIDLAAEIRDDRSPSSRTLFAELHPTGFPPGLTFYARAARGDRYKLIRTHFADGRTVHELYDLRADPSESTNVYEAPASSSSRSSLEMQLDEFMQRAAAYRPDASKTNRIELDPAIRERLRAIGYED
jgi:arylsulfatase A-like enzyme